jgi:hypothetical protein
MWSIGHTNSPGETWEGIPTQPPVETEAPTEPSVYPLPTEVPAVPTEPAATATDRLRPTHPGQHTDNHTLETANTCSALLDGST